MTGGRRTVLSALKSIVIVGCSEIRTAAFRRLLQPNKWMHRLAIAVSVAVVIMRCRWLKATIHVRPSVHPSIYHYDSSRRIIMTPHRACGSLCRVGLTECLGSQPKRSPVRRFSSPVSRQQQGRRRRRRDEWRTSILRCRLACWQNDALLNTFIRVNDVCMSITCLLFVTESKTRTYVSGTDMYPHMPILRPHAARFH